MQSEVLILFVVGDKYWRVKHSDRLNVATCIGLCEVIVEGRDCWIADTITEGCRGDHCGVLGDLTGVDRHVECSRLSDRWIILK